MNGARLRGFPGSVLLTIMDSMIIHGAHAMTKPITILVSFIFGLQLFAGEKSQLVTNLEAGKKQVVVCYGTSLTERGGWVKHIQKALEENYPGLATVVNSGGSGQWSKWGVEKLDNRVLAKKPDTLFIEFGINDSVARFKGSPEIARNNLETMIDRVQKQLPDCEIILMTMTPGNKYQPGHMSYRKNISEYYEMYRAVAKQRGLPLIDNYPKWAALQKDNPELFQKYVPDTIHPTGEGDLNVVTPLILNALGITAAR